MKRKWTKPGFEQTASALKSSRHEVRVDELRNVGNVHAGRVILSKREKAACPRRQRKSKSWQQELN